MKQPLEIIDEALRDCIGSLTLSETAKHIAEALKPYLFYQLGVAQLAVVAEQSGHPSPGLKILIKLKFESIHLGHVSIEVDDRTVLDLDGAEILMQVEDHRPKQELERLDRLRRGTGYRDHGY